MYYSNSTFFSGEVINPHLDQVAMTSEIEGMPMVVVQVLSHIILLIPIVSIKF